MIIPQVSSRRAPTSDQIPPGLRPVLDVVLMPLPALVLAVLIFVTLVWTLSLVLR